MNILKTSSIGLIVSLAWCMFAASLLVGIGINDVIYSTPCETTSYEPFWYTTFFTCVFAPLWEEAAFRYGPISIAKLLGEKAVFPVIIMVSCYFGWEHTGSPEGVLLQGGLGIIFSMVYLKGGYWAAVITHSLYNICMTFGPEWLIQ